MAIALESICPIDRMVATIPDAAPRCCLSTELMIAFVFGEEKSAYPRPRMLKGSYMPYFKRNAVVLIGDPSLVCSMILR